jgi:hypothetical protein
VAGVRRRLGAARSPQVKGKTSLDCPLLRFILLRGTEINARTDDSEPALDDRLTTARVALIGWEP